MNLWIIARGFDFGLGDLSSSSVATDHDNRGSPFRQLQRRRLAASGAAAGNQAYFAPRWQTLLEGYVFAVRTIGNSSTSHCQSGDYARNSTPGAGQAPLSPPTGAVLQQSLPTWISPRWQTLLEKWNSELDVGPRPLASEPI